MRSSWALKRRHWLLYLSLGDELLIFPNRSLVRVWFLVCFAFLPRLQRRTLKLRSPAHRFCTWRVLKSESSFVQLGTETFLTCTSIFLALLQTVPVFHGDSFSSYKTGFVGCAGLKQCVGRRLPCLRTRFETLKSNVSRTLCKWNANLIYSACHSWDNVRIGWDRLRPCPSQNAVPVMAYPVHRSWNIPVRNWLHYSLYVAILWHIRANATCE